MPDLNSSNSKPFYLIIIITWITIIWCYCVTEQFRDDILHNNEVSEEIYRNHSYIINRIKMVEEDKNILELDVVYSIDDEGNSYHEVWNEPAVGYFEDNEFHLYRGINLL